MAVNVFATTGGQIEKFKPADTETMTVAGGQTVRGGRLVEFTANRTVQEAGAGSTKFAGVAMYDGAAGATITVATEGVYLLLASGAIAAGDVVVGAASGQVAAAGATPDARTIVGRAQEAISNGNTGPIKLTTV